MDKSMENFIVGIIFGMLIMLFIFYLLWIVPNPVKETVNGRYFIKTHFSTYELKNSEKVYIGHAINKKSISSKLENK